MTKTKETKMQTTGSVRLTAGEVARARCGQVAAGEYYPRHSGSMVLDRERDGRLAQCRGCGTYFSPGEVRALIAAAVRASTIRT